MKNKCTTTVTSCVLLPELDAALIDAFIGDGESLVEGVVKQALEEGVRERMVLFSIVEAEEENAAVDSTSDETIENFGKDEEDEG